MPMIHYRATPTGLNDPDAFDAEPRAAWVNAETLTVDHRAALKARVESGDLQEIRAWFRVFGNEPNLNGVRPHPDRFTALVEHARDVPFVEMHYGGTRGILGRIFDRRVTTRDDGVEQLELAHRITDREGMLAYLDLKMTDFSVSLRLEDVRCGECEEPAEKFFRWYIPACNCEKKTGETPEFFAHGDTPELLHNAWVPEGAYRDTGVASEFAALDGGLMSADVRARLSHALINKPEKKMEVTREEFEAMKARAEEAEARLEEAEAAKAEALAKAKAADDARFSAAFDAAVSARKVTPSQRAHFDALNEGMGADFAIKTLDGLAPDPRYPGEPVGFATSERVEEAVEPSAEEKRYAAAQTLVRLGLVKEATLEDARAGRLDAIRHPAITRAK